MQNQNNKDKAPMDKKIKRILAASILLIAITAITWTTVRCLQVVTTNTDNVSSTVTRYSTSATSLLTSGYPSSHRYDPSSMDNNTTISTEQQEDIIYLNPSIPTGSYNNASRSPIAPPTSTDSNWISRAPTSYWELETTSPKPPSSSKPISSNPSTSSTTQPPSNTPVSSSTAPPVISIAPSSSKPIKTVNINTASASELADALPLEYLMCKAIVDYRKENGPFSTVEDLMNVDGIGKNLLNRIRPYITI